MEKGEREIEWEKEEREVGDRVELVLQLRF